MLDAVRQYVRACRDRIRDSDRREKRRLVLNEDGFGILDAGRSDVVASVVWGDVQTIRTFKEDVFAYDLICLAFEISADSWIVISEEDDGFMKIAQAMEARFPEIPKTWFWDVELPVFAANVTQLYPYDEMSYQQQVAQQKAAVSPPKPDSLSWADWCCVVCGLAALALLYRKEHFVLAVAAGASAVLTVLAGIIIRRVYDVHEVNWWLVSAVADHISAEEREGLVAGMLEKSFSRAVPLWIRTAYGVVRVSNLVWLLVAGW